jgi:hypothetical protein
MLLPDPNIPRIVRKITASYYLKEKFKGIPGKFPSVPVIRIIGIYLGVCKWATLSELIELIYDVPKDDKNYLKVKLSLVAELNRGVREGRWKKIRKDTYQK